MGLITTLFARKVVRAASDRLDKPALLRSIGIDPDGPQDLAQMVSDATYYKLLETIAEADEEPGELFQLRAGASMRCDDYGALGLAWKSAPNLRSTWERAVRYARLMTSVSSYEIRDDDSGGIYMILHRQGEPRPGLQLSNEATMASITSISREISTDTFSPQAVYFKHKALSPIWAHEQYFGCPVHFESDMDALVISSDALALPNRLGDEGISRFFVSHLDGELAKIGTEKSLEQLVRMEVSKSLSAGIPKMADVAQTLGMSERTLHRKLAAKGTTFKVLVEKSRRQLAEELLHQTNYALVEVAFLTGFSEQSAFQRAFKRWSKQTPAAFRSAWSGANC